MSDFNLDTAEGSEYSPVTITYRKKEYVLGGSAYGLMTAPSVIDLEGKSNQKVGVELIQKLPKLLKLLSPELAKVLKNPTVGEQLLMIKAITEVLNRLGKFRLSNDDDG